MYGFSRQINHRNAIKGFFITFSQCGDFTKQDFYESFSSRFKFEKAVCALEAHKKEGYYIHIAFILEEPKTKTQILNYLREKYPNDYKRIDVESLGSLSQSIKYFVSPDKDKEVDENPIFHNCTPESIFPPKHYVIFRELRDDPDHVKWEICGCPPCNAKYIEYRHSMIHELFGDEPNFEITSIYKN